jgi:cytosine/uracil/thiamine/allantoin permease
MAYINITLGANIVFFVITFMILVGGNRLENPIFKTAVNYADFWGILLSILLYKILRKMLR